MAYFTAGIVLLLNIWGGKRSGLNTDPVKEMADVHKCMKMLKLLEQRYGYVDYLWVLGLKMTCAGGIPPVVYGEFTLTHFAVGLLISNHVGIYCTNSRASATSGGAARRLCTERECRYRHGPVSVRLTHARRDGAASLLLHVGKSSPTVVCQSRPAADGVGGGWMYRVKYALCHNAGEYPMLHQAPTAV